MNKVSKGRDGNVASDGLHLPNNLVSYRSTYHTKGMLPERKVEIPVRTDIRDQIKELKGNRTYDNFFTEVLNLKVPITKSGGHYSFD
jgi:hypothetical protein